MISRQDNITDPSRSDGRCNQANEFHQDYGALSNQVTSPIREQSRNQSFSEDRSDAYLLAQDKIFIVVIDNLLLLLFLLFIVSALRFLNAY